MSELELRNELSNGDEEFLTDDELIEFIELRNELSKKYGDVEFYDYDELIELKKRDELFERVKPLRERLGKDRYQLEIFFWEEVLDDFMKIFDENCEKTGALVYDIQNEKFEFLTDDEWDELIREWYKENPGKLWDRNAGKVRVWFDGLKENQNRLDGMVWYLLHTEIGILRYYNHLLRNKQ